jgi:hypothetical protein
MALPAPLCRTPSGDPSCASIHPQNFQNRLRVLQVPRVEYFLGSGRLAIEYAEILGINTLTRA